MNEERILESNRSYWNQNADFWFGTTALPKNGVNCLTEDKLNLFGDVSDKKLLEICCGSGHSLKYHAERKAAELWGVDISSEQLKNAHELLTDSAHHAHLICSPMEELTDIPENYFDYVYSIYGIGWTTDLQGTFNKIASYLKPNGYFIFSWHHTLNYCVTVQRETSQTEHNDSALYLSKSYFDESFFEIPLHDSKMFLCNRKISTYINALAKAGFQIEEMIEETDEETLNTKVEVTEKMRKAQMLPLSFIIKARKL